MVEPVGNNHNIKLKGTNVQLNNNNVKGIVLNEKSPIFLKNSDKDGDGVISQKEAKDLLNELKKVSKNDTLSSRELEASKLGEKSDIKKIAAIVNGKKAGKVNVSRDGHDTTITTQNSDGTITKVVTQGDKRITSNYDVNGNLTSQKEVNSNGSSESQFKYDENGNLLNKNTVNRDSKNRITGSAKSVYSYDEAGNRIGENRVKFDKKGKPIETTEVKIQNNVYGRPVKISSKTTDAKGRLLSTSSQVNQYQEGKLVSSAIKTSNKDSVVSTQKNYASDGKTLESSYQVVTNKDGTSATTTQRNNKHGKLLEKHTVKKDAKGNVISDMASKTEYASDGKTIKKMTNSGTVEGYPRQNEIIYDSNGKISHIDSMYYKRGEKIVESYDGPNLDNRKFVIPSKQTVYEADGKTIKEVTINKFDKDGILIGEEVRDKDGNVIATHDFSEIDGKFDTSYQKSRGDCYLLAGLNALNESTAGQEALKDTITIGKDPKTGETTYTVHFPGAAKIREELIKQGVPEDQIDIKDSYTYTETEINEHAKRAGKDYSAGDKDVLLVEVAYEDLRTDAKEDIEDLREANPKLTDNKIKQQLHISGLLNNGDNLSGGYAHEPIFMLTGLESEVYKVSGKVDNAPVCNIDSELNMTVAGGEYNISAKDEAKLDSMFDKIEQDCKDGQLDNYAATVGFTVASQTVNGKLVRAGGHAFTITKVEGDNVYLKNPWDPTKEIVMTRDEVKHAATKLSLADINSDQISHNENDTPIAPTQENNTTSNTTQNMQEIVQQINHHLTQQSHQQIVNGLHAGASYTIPEGQGYLKLIVDALKTQGIEPNETNIKKAKEQFKAANKGAVHVYNGSNSKYRGNEYLIKGEVVKIPKFEM